MIVAVKIGMLLPKEIMQLVLEYETQKLFGYPFGNIDAGFYGTIKENIESLIGVIE